MCKKATLVSERVTDSANANEAGKALTEVPMFTDAQLLVCATGTASRPYRLSLRTFTR